jgi:hypothetical protein
MTKGSINTDHEIVINWFLMMMLMPHAIYCPKYGVRLNVSDGLVWTDAK